MYPRRGALIGAFFVVALATLLFTASVQAASAGNASFTASSYSVQQSAGAITLTVSRSGGAAGAVTVGYTTQHGTASAGVEYTSTAGTLAWANNDTGSKTITVPISKTGFSGSKNFRMNLQNPTGGVTIGGSVTVTIVGSGTGGTTSGAYGTLALAAPSYSVTASSGSVTIVVNRSSGSNGAVTVGYGTANGSAQAGSDYTASSGVLKWAAGDASPKSFVVSVNKSLTTAKTFSVSVSSATGGATLGAPASATVTVTPVVVTQPTGGKMGNAAAARLLNQGTFGATLGTLSATANQTYDQWFQAQAAATPTLYLPQVPTQSARILPAWLKTVNTSSDQLRQRVAFALSEIFVVSDNSTTIVSSGNALANYYDILVRDALGNFRTLLQDVTLSPEMGMYLSMFKNDKPDPATGVHADENYARECMQLFTIGLNKLNMDGTLQTSGNGPIPTYDLDQVTAMARVLTGWGSKANGHPYGEQSWDYDIDQMDPMVSYPAHHDTDAKTIVGDVQVAAGGTPEADLKIALDTLFNHQNAAPFFAKQMIEKLVTSNPSPAYVKRVATVFANNGAGVRGDLLAVVKAILTDSEAVNAGGSGYGKLREPLLRLTGLWRAFDAVGLDGKYSQGELMYGNQFFIESPLDSPSVFNFFRPDYQLAGPLTNANLVVPEFQILNENSLVQMQNELAALAYQYIDSKGNRHAGTDFDATFALSSSSVMLHTAAWEGFAATPATLVSQLNLVLMANQMSPSMQATLSSYVAGIPATTPWARVAEAASLIINSPQYAIQR